MNFFIDEPLPALSLPSNTMITVLPVSDNQFCNLINSTCKPYNSLLYIFFGTIDTSSNEGSKMSEGTSTPYVPFSLNSNEVKILKK